MHYLSPKSGLYGPLDPCCEECVASGVSELEKREEKKPSSSTSALATTGTLEFEIRDEALFFLTG
jgi:hypothetical protein